MPPQDVLFWHQFESFVAEIYRKLGAQTVKQNYSLAGTQIDVYVEEQTKSGQILRSNVECKYYKSKVGVEIVRQFAGTAHFLKNAGKVDKNILVAYNGFTKDAYLAAENSGIELTSFADLEQKLVDVTDSSVLGKIDQKIKLVQQPERFSKTIFVMMPFAEEMNDLYIYGIRGCAEKLGLKCVRADELEHNSSILQEVKDYIKKSDILIGEMTDLNPNVYYEVGFAHGCEREIILITKQAEKIPFDLKHQNHIVYSSISDLEKKLTQRIKSMF
jgi:hypothetical protein